MEQYWKGPDELHLLPYASRFSGDMALFLHYANADNPRARERKRISRQQDQSYANVYEVYRNEEYFDIDQVIPEGSDSDLILISVFVDYYQPLR